MTVLLACSAAITKGVNFSPTAEQANSTVILSFDFLPLCNHHLLRLEILKVELYKKGQFHLMLL